MEEEFEGVVEKLKKVILPCYVKGSKVKAGPSHVHGNDEDQITTLLKDEMPKVVLEGEKEDVSYCFYCYTIYANDSNDCKHSWSSSILHKVLKFFH